MNTEFVKIDTIRTNNHVRHIASIDERGWAHTKCGRRVIMFFRAEQTSYFYTDGSRYSKPCPYCLPEEQGSSY